jgi:hypothetical protein
LVYASRGEQAGNNNNNYKKFRLKGRDFLIYSLSEFNRGRFTFISAGLIFILKEAKMDFKVTAKITLEDIERKRPSHISIVLELDSKDKILLLGLFSFAKLAVQKRNPDFGIISITVRIISKTRRDLLVRCRDSKGDRSFVLDNAKAILVKLEILIGSRDAEFRAKYREKFRSFDCFEIKPIFRANDGNNLKRKQKSRH